ncbi:MAG: hypothetical protein ACERIH_12075 [Labilibaculum antarcticum]
MKKIVATLLILFCMSSVNYAQDYNTGIGLRAGYSNGLTIKHFISNKTALEGILSSRWQGVELTGLYEIQNRIANAERLNWYFGFGAHIGIWDGDHADWGTRGKSYTVVGLDGIIGLEYDFTEIPINIGIDWKPTLNVFGYNGFWGDGGALSIRYIF